MLCSRLFSSNYCSSDRFHKMCLWMIVRVEELEAENQELVRKLHEEEANVRAWRSYASQPLFPSSSGLSGRSTLTTSTSTVSGGLVSASALATRPRVTAAAPTYLSVICPTRSFS